MGEQNVTPEVQETKKEFKLTPGRQVILRSLEGKTAKWSELRSAYYGPDRAKAKASTSFHMQLTKLQALGIVAKDGEVYKLTVEGEAILAKTKEQGIDLMAARSPADLAFVAPPAPIIPQA